MRKYNAYLIPSGRPASTTVSCLLCPLLALDRHKEDHSRCVIPCNHYSSHLSHVMADAVRRQRLDTAHMYGQIYMASAIHTHIYYRLAVMLASPSVPPDEMISSIVSDSPLVWPPGGPALQCKESSTPTIRSPTARRKRCA